MWNRILRALMVAYVAATAIHIGFVMAHEPFAFDAWNIANSTPEEVAGKDAVLRRWCEELGRDPDEIERTVSLGPVAIRDDPAEAARLVAGYHERNRAMTRPVVTGSSEQIVEWLRGYVALGFRHLIFHLVPPYDDETLVRFATEVGPALEG